MSKKPLTNDVGEVRELDADDFAGMKSVAGDFPDLVEAQRRGELEVKRVGRPRVENPKQPVTIRLSPEVTEYFRGTGKGWQTRVDAVLRSYIADQDSE